MAEPRNSYRNCVKNHMVDPGLSDAKRHQGARHIVRERVCVPVNVQGDLDNSLLVFSPGVAFEVVSAYFLSSCVIAESDSNLIAASLSKAAAPSTARGSLTEIAAAWTTAATGQVGDLADGTLKTWTMNSTQATRQLTSDQGVYLTIDETGTGPALQGTVILNVEYMD